jgi:hypothetical protein
MERSLDFAFLRFHVLAESFGGSTATEFVGAAADGSTAAICGDGAGFEAFVSAGLSAAGGGAVTSGAGVAATFGAAGGGKGVATDGGTAVAGGALAIAGAA